MFKAVCKVIYLLLYYHQVSYKPYQTPHRIIYPKGFISLINLIQSIPCRFTNCYIHLALPESKNSSNCLILIVGRIYTFSRDSVYHVISLSFISDSEAFEAFDGFIDMALAVTPSIADSSVARPDSDHVLPSQAMVASGAYSIVDGDMASLDVPDFANMPFDEVCRTFLNE